MRKSGTQLTIIVFLWSFSFSYAQDLIFSTEKRFDATFHHISVHYGIEGDDNLNSELLIKYKEVGETDSRDAAMTMRAFPGMVIDGNETNRNYHAGSIMFLKPNTSYDVDLLLSDPDNGVGYIVSQHVVTTKAIPQHFNGPQIKYVIPGNGGGLGTIDDPYRGLQEAADNAQAGNHFRVGAGIYQPFTLLENGTHEDPISFTSIPKHSAVIDGEGINAGIITLGEFSSTIENIIIDGFTIQDGRWAIDAQNTQFVTVRNNIIQDVAYGYVNRREQGLESDQYITNNLILGTTAWPQSGIPGERAIDLRGNNNVVSFNTIKDFGDGISTDGPPYETSYSMDIHNNDIQNIVDDLIEVDGTICNSRIYANRCFNGRAGVSLAPIYGGPTYVFRNVLFNLEFSGFKMNRGPAGLILVNNTVVCDENASSSPNGWQNTFCRNNVMFSTRYCFEMYGLVPNSIDDWDYGAFYSTRTGAPGSEWFKWDNQRYADVSELQNSGLLHANAISVTPSDFANIELPAPYPTSYDPSERDFTPMSNSAIVNSGFIMKQLQESFVSDGMPDRGAIELGDPMPQYGHLFDFDSSTSQLLAGENIEIFPNPFKDQITINGAINNTTIRILDCMGAVILKKESTASIQEINLSELPSGMYFVQVTDQNKQSQSTFKLFKK